MTLFEALSDRNFDEYLVIVEYLLNRVLYAGNRMLNIFTQLKDKFCVILYNIGNSLFLILIQHYFEDPG